MDRFLLVSLNIEAILGEVTIGQRRRKLEAMARGNGLSDAYAATLTRIKAQKGNKSMLGLKVLMWVLYSERPLRVEELCHALGVEIGSQDLDPKNIPVMRTLQSACLGLVTVEASPSTFRLVHFTLREHLLSNQTLFPSPHSTIAEVCLTYLNFGCVQLLSPTLDPAPSTMPLLEYASHYWGNHTRMGLTENVKILVLRLLDRFDEHISAQLLLLHHNTVGGSGPYFYGTRGLTGFTGLHAAAFLGILEIVTGLLETKEWNVNKIDCMGSTALIWAASKGHEEVVKILLQLADINPDQADTRYGQTPLSWAAKYGHAGVVKILLERGDVDPDQVSTVGARTPLSWAALDGHVAVVKMLLEREDVNPNLVEIGYEQTLLWWAVWEGHDDVVKMLLGREDINPNQVEFVWGHTPLTWAAMKGHKLLIKMLLDINPNQADTTDGITPLAWAALNGHVRIVEILLEREDVNHSLVPGPIKYWFNEVRNKKKRKKRRLAPQSGWKRPDPFKPKYYRKLRYAQRIKRRKID